MKRSLESTASDGASASASRREATVVLVDMDGTIANFDQRALDLLAERHPEIGAIDFATRSYPLANTYADGASKAALKALFSEPGFFAEMAPIEGAVEALHAMVKAGIDVRLCSSPLAKSPRCAMEKVEWIVRHLGQPWVDRLILARDKTFVRGHVLIDDAPSAKGSSLAPVWEHVYFDQPYNRPGAAGADPARQRLTAWAEWRTLLADVTQRPPI